MRLLLLGDRVDIQEDWNIEKRRQAGGKLRL